MSKKSSSRNYALAAKGKREKLEAPVLPYEPPFPRRYRPEIALVGCGGITAAHLGAYRAAGWNVSAFFDLDQARAKHRRDEFYPKARVCGSLEEILSNPKIKVVDVATHPAERVSLIEACLRAHKHVLSQKPFVLDLRAGHRLVKLARDKGVHLAVNQNGRWAPHFSYLRLAAQQGVIGPVGALTTSVSWDHTWTKGTPFERMRHLLLYDFGIHWFDFVCQIFKGQRALKVAAFLECAKGQPIKPPLLGSIAIHFEQGVANLGFHGHSQGGQLDLTVVTGDEGLLFSQGPGLTEQKVVLQTRRGRAPVPLKGNWFTQGFQGTMGELLCSIEEKRVPSNGAEDNLHSLALCFAAIKATGSGRPEVPGKVLCAPPGCKPE